MIILDPAPRWKHLLATLLDILLVAVSLLPVWIGSAGHGDRFRGVLAAGVALLVVVFYQSLLLLEIEQTAGMRLFGLFIDPLGAVHVDRITVALRLWVPSAIAAAALIWDARRGGAILLGALGLDLLWLALPGGRCLHDVVTGTRVLDGGEGRRPVSHARLILRAAWLSAITAAAIFAIVTALVLVGVLGEFFRWFGHMG